MTFTQAKTGWSCRPESKGGFKSPASWLLEALGARWTHRRGYTLSERAKTDFCAFQAAGVTARWRIAAKDRDPKLFQIPGVEGYVTRAEVRKWVEGRSETFAPRGAQHKPTNQQTKLNNENTENQGPEKLRMATDRLCNR